MVDPHGDQSINIQCNGCLEFLFRQRPELFFSNKFKYITQYITETIVVLV